MGCYLRHALQTFIKLQPAAVHSIYFAGLLKAGQKALASADGNKEFKRHFVDALGVCRPGVVEAMQGYVTSHPVKMYAVRNAAEDGNLMPKSHMAQHGDINALTRVIVLMAEPTVICLFNPNEFFHSHARIPGASYVAHDCE